MNLTRADYDALLLRWITREWADAAQLERLDNLEGAQHVGRSARGLEDYFNGLWIPYLWPPGVAAARGSMEGGAHAGRLRRDKADIEILKNGRRKEKNKYLVAPGSMNRLYLPPLILASHLADVNLPIIFTEGEFKALALRRAASYMGGTSHNGNGGTDPIYHLRFLPIAVGGVNNWRGKIGKLLESDGTMAYEVGPSPDFSFLEWPNRKVVIAYDMDQVGNPNVRAALHGISSHFLSLGCNVGTLMWPLLRDGKEAKGVDDWLARDGIEALLDALNKVEFRDRNSWQSKLYRHVSTGAIKPLLINASIALSESPEWRGQFANDVFLQQVYCRQRLWNGKAGPWIAEDDIRLTCWLQEQGIDVKREVAAQAVVAAASESNCLKEWIDSLEWDGIPRLDNWVITYMGCRTDRDGKDITSYVCSAGAKWMIGLVMRAIDPGSQMDYCLVFRGPEGQGKSRAMEIIGHGWHTNTMRDISSQFAACNLSGGVWLIEFAELEAWGKADWRVVKNFITTRVDHTRDPHSPQGRKRPRMCVCCATTNEQTYIDDDGTEQRRFWTLEVQGPIDLVGLERDLPQLIAEARERGMGGEKPYFADELIVNMARQEREYVKQDHPWSVLIEDYLNKRGFVATPVTTQELLSSACGVEKERLGNTGHARHVAKILQKLNYEPCLYTGPNGERNRRGWEKKPNGSAKSSNHWEAKSTA